MRNGMVWSEYPSSSRLPLMLWARLRRSQACWLLHVSVRVVPKARTRSGSWIDCLRGHPFLSKPQSDTLCQSFLCRSFSAQVLTYAMRCCWLLLRAIELDSVWRCVHIFCRHAHSHSDGFTFHDVVVLVREDNVATPLQEATRHHCRLTETHCFIHSFRLPCAFCFCGVVLQRKNFRQRTFAATSFAGASCRHLYPGLQQHHSHKPWGCRRAGQIQYCWASFELGDLPIICLLHYSFSAHFHFPLVVEPTSLQSCVHYCIWHREGRFLLIIHHLENTALLLLQQKKSSVSCWTWCDNQWGDNVRSCCEDGTAKRSEGLWAEQQSALFLCWLIFQARLLLFHRSMHHECNNQISNKAHMQRISTLCTGQVVQREVFWLNRFVSNIK